MSSIRFAMAVAAAILSGGFTRAAETPPLQIAEFGDLVLESGETLRDAKLG